VIIQKSASKSKEEVKEMKTKVKQTVIDHFF